MIDYNYKNKPHIQSESEQQEIYSSSIKNHDSFWANKAEEISWIKKWDRVSDVDYSKAKISWFEGAKLNVSYNCIDRHVEAGFGDSIAIIWEGNNPNKSKKITYKELLKEVCLFANVLKKHGVEKGDRVCIYMQMIP